MDKNKNNHKNGKTGSQKQGEAGGLDEESLTLWKALTQDVEKFPEKTYVEAQTEESGEGAGEEKPAIRETIPLARKKAEKSITPDMRGLDRRTAQKLKRGQIRPEAHIDLHGYTQIQARHALKQFIERSHAGGLRCVLVITGKGQRHFSYDYKEERAPRRGILRVLVPHWLKEENFRQKVLSSHVAKPKDGGEGALYVLLRKKRD